MAPGDAGGMMMMDGGMGGMGMSGPVEDMSFQKNEEETLMVRSIDFTVEPDTTYRYQVRIVVVNPNRYHTNVNPGVDTESEPSIMYKNS